VAEGSKAPIVWLCVGGGTAVLGLALTMTGIGAICGVPLFLVGLPMSWYGKYKYDQGRRRDLIESVRAGVAAGVQGGTTCPGCGTALPPGTKFCSSCGRSIS